MRFAIVWLAVLGAIATSTTSSLSVACGNEVERRVDPRVEALVLAEGALRSSDYRTAARMALRYNPNLRKADDNATEVARAARIMALVVVRTGGQWLTGGRLVQGGPAERARNLEWAVSKLRRHSMRALHHPGRMSDLGEALASLEKYHDEARAILEHLAAKDLVTTAQAYAALARLRAASGDAGGASHALRLCRKLDSKSPVCGPPPGSSGA